MTPKEDVDLTAWAEAKAQRDAAIAEAYGLEPEERAPAIEAAKAEWTAEKERLLKANE